MLGDMWKYVVISHLNSPVHYGKLTQYTRFHRSISRPAFARDRISDYELFDRHARVVISQLKQRLCQGHAVDFQVRLHIHFVATLR